MKFSARKFVSSISSRTNHFRAKALLGCVAALSAGPALATSYTPATFDGITFPVDPASIGLVVGGAGAAIMLITFAWKGGFKMIVQLFHTLFKTSRG